VDVKALLRIAVVYNVPIACNRATADFILSSPLMREDYRRSLSIDDDSSRRSGEVPSVDIAALLEPLSGKRLTT
jgi:hypothetical protein